MSNKNIELLNIQEGSHVVVPEYLKKEYLEKGYLVLPSNKFIKKSLLIFSINFWRKIIFIFNFSIKNKFYWKFPPEQEIIIFDDENIDVLKKIFTKQDYFILPTRLNKIKVIYICKEILFYLIKNFFRRSIKQNYLVSLIKIIKPKKVITFIDNSEDFFLVSKILKNENIRFIAIQNSHRYEIHAKNKNIHIPKYFVFGNHEVEIFKKNLGIKEIKPIGSLSAAVAKQYLLNNETNIKSDRFDICLISEPRIKLNHDFKRIHKLYDVQEHVGLIAEYTLKFCKKNNKSIIFSGKSDRKSLNFQSQEKKFYQKFLKNSDVKISFNDKKKFEQYKNLMESNLIIGMSSTLLRDAFEFKKKILICNFIDHEDTRAPTTGICTLNSTIYSDFENRVNKILSMSYEEYLNEIKDVNFIYNMETNALDFLKNELIEK
jgi:surface carbohydrate biosynthesis protein